MKCVLARFVPPLLYFSAHYYYLKNHVNGYREKFAGITDIVKHVKMRNINVVKKNISNVLVKNANTKNKLSFQKN